MNKKTAQAALIAYLDNAISDLLEDQIDEAQFISYAVGTVEIMLSAWFNGNIEEPNSLLCERELDQAYWDSVVNALQENEDG